MSFQDTLPIDGLSVSQQVTIDDVAEKSSSLDTKDAVEDNPFRIPTDEELDTFLERERTARQEVF